MRIERAVVKFFDVPTEVPEKDGTLEWQSTGLVTLELYAQNHIGLGYTYADRATSEAIVQHGLPVILGRECGDHFILVEKIKKLCRNLGNSGISAMALSAIDIALWDLRARSLNISIQELLGIRRRNVSFYGSGLFLSNETSELTKQVHLFKELGIHKFKMKIGEDLEGDMARVRLVRDLIGKDSDIYVDANGAYNPKAALNIAYQLAKENVSWFEEPITSDDKRGLQYLRNNFPYSLQLVAGEYCYQTADVLELLENKAVDVLMVDATRCEGISGMIIASHLARAFNIPFSTHCAPLLHGNIGVSFDNLLISENFYDHYLIERKYFEHQGSYENGKFIPDENQCGFGWKLRKNKEHLIYEFSDSRN
jgi:L-alanine-DL-glutamate epimerase-like enolase superfamily enzyme